LGLSIELSATVVYGCLREFTRGTRKAILNYMFAALKLRATGTREVQNFAYLSARNRFYQ